jgi:hypothetical protein
MKSYQTPMASKDIDKAKLAAMAVLATACVAFAGASVLTLGGADILDISQRDEDRANEALALQRPDLDAASADTWAALSQAPMTASAWSRLAYIDQVRSGRLTTEGRQYLERSYAVAPLGPDITPWRVRFAYENWQYMTPDLRQSAIAELRILTRYRGWVAKDLPAEIQNPTGRFAAGMTIDLAKQDRKRDRALRMATVGN